MKTSVTNSVRKSELTIYFYNVVEDEWSFIDTLTDQFEKKQEIERSQETADSYFLGYSNSHDLLFVSPKNISAAFQAYSRKVTHSRNVEVIVPVARTNLLCLDAWKDKNVFNFIVEKSQDYDNVKLISYVASSQLYDLYDKLAEKNVRVSLPEAPAEDAAWTVNYFGSKSGIRQLAQKSGSVEPDFIMPDGIICVGRFDASKIAANKYCSQKGVVIKTNKGTGGNGVLIFRENELPDKYSECEKYLFDILGQHKYWEVFPIIIEDLVNTKMEARNFPNIEFKIHKNGRIEMLYYCVTIVTKKGEYIGLDINEDVIDDRTAAQIIDTGYYIAEQYSKSGYRGYFDVDMISSRNKIFVCESNTRNTGGTDVYKLALGLLGKDFYKDYYVLTRSHLPLSTGQSPSFEQVISILQPILYNRRTRQGVIVNSENILAQKELIYTIIARSKKKAYALQSEMMSLLEELT